MSVLGMSGAADVGGQILHVQVVGETDSGRLFVRPVGLAGREHLIASSAFRSDLAVWPEPLSDDVRRAALDLATAIERAKAMSGHDRLLGQEDYKILHDGLEEPDRYPFASALVEYGVRVRTAQAAEAAGRRAVVDPVSDPHTDGDGLSKHPELRMGPGGAGEARGVGQDPQDAPGSYPWTPADAGDGISNPGAESEHDYPWPRKVEGRQLGGNVFGCLTVLGKSTRGGRYWDCLCSCGNRTVARGDHLKRGETRSCGHTQYDLDDLTGRTFGRLTVSGLAGNGRRGITFWDCECVCGETVVVRRGSLTTGATQSCGCLHDERNGAFEDLTGLVFSRLRVVRHAGLRGYGNHTWECLCDCGASTIVSGSSLKNGHTKSCGCFSREVHRSLGGERHPRWKGGVTPENAKFRHSADYLFWRRSVLSRDSFTCRDCSQVGGKLHAHHILAFADHPNSRLDVDNGLTLCKICHAHRHGWKKEDDPDKEEDVGDLAQEAEVGWSGSELSGSGSERWAERGEDEQAGIGRFAAGDRAWGPGVSTADREQLADDRRRVALGMSDLLKHPRQRPKSPLEKKDKSTDGVEKDSDLNTPSGRDRGLNPSVHEEIGEAYRDQNQWEDPDLHLGMRDLLAARPDAPAVQAPYTSDRPVAEGDGDGAYARFDMDEVDIQPTAQAWTRSNQGKVVQREVPGSSILLVMLPDGHIQSAMSPEAALALARKWFRKNLKTDIGIGGIDWGTDDDPIEPPRTAQKDSIGTAGDAVEPPAFGKGVESDMGTDSSVAADAFGLAAMSMRQLGQGVDNRLSDPDVHTDIDEQRGDRGIPRAPEDEDLRYAK